jgi:hypothetical protein
MCFPLCYKQSLWVEHIGEEFKTTCGICNKSVNAFAFDIEFVKIPFSLCAAKQKENKKSKKPIFKHIKC